MSKGATGEGSLDVEFITGVAPRIPATVWATAGQRYDPGDGKYDNEPFLTWIMNVSAVETPPNVFSISYQDYEDTLSLSFMNRLNTEFARLAMRGVTLVTGSGDWGVGCSSEAPNGTKKQPLRYRADFPSSSPYVVSVGATTFPPDPFTPTIGEEIAVGFSSGGFSNIFARPAYQSDAVAAFLKRTATPTSFFNASGRGFPDVAALGVRFTCVINAKNQSVDGTSASSPTFAGILALLNEVRLGSGKPTIGWANPLLYASHIATAHKQRSSSRSMKKNARAFHDVIVGNNGHAECSVGFNATVGWDPITGLGTPHFPSLLAQMMVELAK
jgi:tripeptidyl-peptidase-1